MMMSFSTAGNLDCKPHICHAETKQHATIVLLLQELQWDSHTLCEKIYGDKVRVKTVRLWSFAPLDKQPVIYQHSQSERKAAASKLQQNA